MERESFEDERVAEILNKDFISIKVDREERPDIDHIYMTVCQALTGSGGWPLSIFLTPDKKPFFAGTYFPREDRYGGIGFISLLKQIIRVWNENRSNITRTGDEILKAVNESFFKTANLKDSINQELSENIIHEAYKMLEMTFDKEYGGFGHAPKFPTPHNILFLLRYWHGYGCDKALEMAEHTLKSMYKGGIYDHIGFGFSRYSTDNKWLIPHFEKMLYDNALLSIAYIEAFQATKDSFYKTAAEEILTYVLRDMTSVLGAFFSAEDADSEGVEGKFYIWSRDEIIKHLGDEKGKEFCDFYNITDTGNFEGLNIPNLIGKDNQELGILDNFKESRHKLLKNREKRVHPFKDDKILTSWNGLMIAALSLAGRVFDNTGYTKAAEKASDFILSELRNNKGRLLARYRDGDASIPGYADDYAFFIWGLMELFMSTHNARYLESAISLKNDFIKYFWDDEYGGFFLYGNDAEQLISRPKEVYDGAMPSANSQGAYNLIRLSRITGNVDMIDKVNRIFKGFANTVKAHPLGYTHLLSAVLYDIKPSKEIILVGLKGDSSVKKMWETVKNRYAPFDVSIIKYIDHNAIQLEKVVPYVKGYKMKDNRAAAYVCSNFTCRKPVSEIEELKEILKI